jgi:hypothetical protein
MILIPDNIHPNVVRALNELQQQEVSLNDLARTLGVKPNWLHLLKSKGVGAETLRKVILVNNYLVKHHPDLLDSAPDTQADCSATPTSGGNNDHKAVASYDRHGVAVALSGSGCSSQSGSGLILDSRAGE